MRMTMIPKMGWLAAALAAWPAMAQVPPVLPQTVDPGALQQRRIEEEERRRMIERAEQQRSAPPAVEAPPAPAATKADDTVRFEVREVSFTASEIFSAEELQAFANALKGPNRTLADVQATVAEINAIYRKRGVVTARAVLPPQNVAGGVVQIRLVEGRVGEVRVQGATSTHPDYVRNRISLQPGQLVSLPALEDDMLWFNRTTDAQLQAQLKPGASFGTTDVLINISEPPRHLLRVAYDTLGSRSTGELRTSVGYYNRSLLGYRDEASITTTQSRGQQSYAAGYTFPFNRQGGRLSLSYYDDNTQIRFGPFKQLDVSGKSNSALASVRQPLVITRQAQFDLLVSAKQRRTDNYTAGVFLTRVETTDASVGGEWQWLDNAGYWVANYAYTNGRERTVDRSRYHHGRGWLRRQHQLSEGWNATGTLSFQHTSIALLPSSEQFVIGGEGSVRGYPVGTWSGETGYVASFELQHPIGQTQLGTAGTTLSATGFLFLDHGDVKPFRPPETTLSSHQHLTSVGWGVNAAFGQHTSTRLTLAYAMNKVPEQVRGRMTAQFQLVVNFY
ncbi:ShlB/FhaC/HecB family hemolysin secretion/activation protein [Aquabacterium fontiphilum]|uniref:ShlB/FhaC/HecB family hemolysin secretion/activation protein n=1 Tax=Aquabacterium fontiphilum TaxID=450365 RepID=UPI0013773DD1|nr:ShlB/FhaC/HecB family hemolysin secretion/activation protein [Aquabacterium fontiphilum]NBD21897.1 ShlB/FhaC/HecB family hemolysin secretion/activation protein [Aquabacterium fontiphilum]